MMLGTGEYAREDFVADEEESLWFKNDCMLSDCRDLGMHLRMKRLTLA